MLLLTRRVGEKIRINDDITVVVLGINGLQVRLGIEAPKGVEVHREEIYQRIQAERQEPLKPSARDHYVRMAAEVTVQP